MSRVSHFSFYVKCLSFIGFVEYSAGMPADPPAPAGVRERNKRRRRQAIVSAAQELFASRGYDAVTVAEIAQAAGVSVKTLFTYVDSKEDLVFADQDTFLDQLLRAVRERTLDQTPLDSMTEVLLAMVDSDDGADGLEAFHRTVGTSPAVASRLRRMWEEFEDALAATLAVERNEANPSPQTRLAAAQMIAMVRVMTSQEVRDFVGVRRTPSAQRESLKQWIERASAQIGAGLER
jgi:AcrR family transcriptional regulator